MTRRVNRIVLGALLLLAMLGAPSLVAAAPTADAAGSRERYIVVARSDADYDALRSQIERSGGSIVKDMRDGGMLVVNATAATKAQIEATGLSRGVARDHIETLIQPTAKLDLTNSSAQRSKTVVNSAASAAIAAAQGRRTVTGDPAFGYPGLMWSIQRINAPQAWQTTTGSPQIRVGVADTGLDFTHSELGPRISQVVDFTPDENQPPLVPICKTFFGLSDADLAAATGGPEKTDWNGHGSWIGGNIAAALDGQGVNGIAPNVKLVSLKISQWCGSAYDSTIMDAFLYAGKHNIDIVSISFGGYLDARDPSQALILLQYGQVVQKVRDQGTVIVAAAGNEHVQIGQGGLVTSHGPLTNPAASGGFGDLFNQFEVPGGLPGVVDVSSTGNFVAAPTAGCVTNGDINTVCKPTSDPHQPAGVGKQNQLSYFSNYGPRIDVAGPGGARKFNLPFWDNGGTPGFPYTTSDFTTAFEDFSTTSNWAVEIPCFVFTGGGFPANQCYSTIQGTSMATPHASGVLALIASNDRSARGNPDRLVRSLKNSARDITGNKTQVLSATDMSVDDQTGTSPCVSGYCHLGGSAVSDREAYGAGLVDAQRAVKR